MAHLTAAPLSLLDCALQRPAYSGVSVMQASSRKERATHTWELMRLLRACAVAACPVRACSGTEC